MSMSNETLVHLLQTEGDPDGKLTTQLWIQNKAYVYKLAKHFAGLAELDDLVQEGFFGLCRAVEKYQLESGNLFITFAHYWIRQAMQRYIEGASSVSFPAYQNQQKYYKFCQRFESKHGRQPTDQEVCQGLNVNATRLQTIKTAAQALETASLDTSVKDPEGNKDGATVGDLISDEGGDPENIVLDRIQAEDTQRLWDIVDSLYGQAPEVLRLRYQQGLKFREIDQVLNRKPGYSSATTSNVIKILRQNPEVQRLREYLEG